MRMMEPAELVRVWSSPQLLFRAAGSQYEWGNLWVPGRSVADAVAMGGEAWISELLSLRNAPAGSVSALASKLPQVRGLLRTGDRMPVVAGVSTLALADVVGLVGDGPDVPSVLEYAYGTEPSTVVMTLMKIVIPAVEYTEGPVFSLDFLEWADRMYRETSPWPGTSAERSEHIGELMIRRLTQECPENAELMRHLLTSIDGSGPTLPMLQDCLRAVS